MRPLPVLNWRTMFGWLETKVIWAYKDFIGQLTLPQWISGVMLIRWLLSSISSRRMLSRFYSLSGSGRNHFMTLNKHQGSCSAGKYLKTGLSVFLWLVTNIYANVLVNGIIAGPGQHASSTLKKSTVWILFKFFSTIWRRTPSELRLCDKICCQWKILFL